MIEFLQKARKFKDRIAILDETGEYTFGDLLEHAEKFASFLMSKNSQIKGQRISFFVPPGFHYVSVQWGIWLAGAVAVPLCLKHPEAQLKYVLEDTKSVLLIYSNSLKEHISGILETQESIALENISWNRKLLSKVENTDNALIIYTSGTTGKPKGVVSTHANLKAQVESLLQAWEWQAADRILNVLPLHHVHGVINATCCPLAVGASVHFLTSFKEEEVLRILTEGTINVFMAVPTIYYKLIKVLESQKKQDFSHFRLMVSGSAALPETTLEKWKKLTGQTLLERYGMTEIGMAISNPLHGERRPGYIGKALPNVQVRLDLVNENEKIGEIQIKGPTVFKEYWQRSKETKDSFTKDGWFKTGDTATMVDGYYKILGRTSVDIIKSGGFKLSALEIEDVLRTYHGVEDAAVVGIPDEEWGELVVAALTSTIPLEQDSISQYLKRILPGYKVPKRFLIVQDFPRNAMGKVMKNELKNLFQPK